MRLQETNIELGFPANLVHVISPDSYLYNLSLLEMDTRCPKRRRGRGPRGKVGRRSGAGRRVRGGEMRGGGNGLYDSYLHSLSLLKMDARCFGM